MEAPRSVLVPTDASGGRDDRRSRPRRSVRGVRCAVGLGEGKGWVIVPARVVDFSTTGIRLRMPVGWPPRTVRRMKIVARGVRLDVEAKCIWSRREGRWSYIVGAAFRGMAPHDEAMLADLLARHGVESVLPAAAAA